MGHKDDFAFGVLVAIVAPFHNSLLSNTSVPSTLVEFPGEHTVQTSAFSPPYDTFPRNITAWISARLTVGAETYAENVVGGPSKNPNSFNPAVAQWLRPAGTVGWATYHPQVKSLIAVADEGWLNLTYPDWEGADRDNAGAFSILVGTNGPEGKRDVTGWEDVDGVSVTVDGNVEMEPLVSFNGLFGGAGDVIK